MSRGIGSTVPRRQLGRHLRALREKSGLRTTDVAKQMDWSQPTISRLEIGHTSVRPIDVERMCQIYGADDETTAGLVALARETRTPDWWRTYGDAIPRHLDLLLGLEQAASSLRCYEGYLVPGLLQTPRYAEVVMRDEPAEDAEKRIKARMDRQALLTRDSNPPQYDVILDEEVLFRPIAPKDVMVEQLNKLIEATHLPNVTLRVVPRSAGFHQGVLTGAFVIMDFPTATDPAMTEPTTVYVEAFTSAVYFDRPADVAQYVEAFTRMQKVSLDERASLDLLAQAARDLQ